MNHVPKGDPRGPTAGRVWPVLKRVGRREETIAGLLFLCAFLGGTAYVLTWNGTQFFYQNLFGPAVMFAYGRGYVNPDLDAAPKLYDFLDVSREFNAGLPPDIDTFDKVDLPDGLPTKPLNAIQRRELYLLGSAALIWRMFGVAWSSLAPLSGLFLEQARQPHTVSCGWA